MNRRRRIPQTGVRGYTARMNRRYLSRLSAFVLALALPFLLAGCGNKGPLVLPDKPNTETPASDDATESAPASDASTDASEPPPHRDR
jgi:predicted small lipoprotein YifL